jgi:SAM-dependent methyltransferase
LLRAIPAAACLSGLMRQSIAGLTRSVEFGCVSKARVQRSMFVVPDKFNRNAANVVAMGPPADTGLWLIKYMCERIEIPDLAGLDVLDFGCGVRFADSIVNRVVPLKSYIGIDVYQEMIDFLSSNVTDSRLSFFHLNARNPTYNKDGVPLERDTTRPIGDRLFDVICMFSVITHQLPEDAGAIFAILRRYVKAHGRLFFSASVEEGDFGYRENVPESPTALSIYSPDLLRELLETSGWRILSIAPRNLRGLPILHSLLCAPA